MRGLLLATTAIVALGGQAFASDLLPAPMPVKVPVYQPVELFAGWYVGINAGYGWGSDKIGVSGADPRSQAAVDALAALGGLPTSFSPGPGGPLVGAQLGYNFQYGKFLAGIETDIDWANVQGSSTWRIDPGNRSLPSSSFVNLTDKLTWLGTTRARVGFTITDSWLVYGTGGLAYGGVETDANFKFAPVQVDANNSATQLGWAAGAGTEYALTTHLLARVEWLHYDLGTATWNVPVAKTPFTGVISTRTDGDIVRGGLSYRF
jgi:outer membrane immunogenic protein